MKMNYYLFMETPVGMLRLVERDGALSEVLRTKEIPPAPSEEKETVLLMAVRQLCFSLGRQIMNILKKKLKNGLKVIKIKTIFYYCIR